MRRAIGLAVIILAAVVAPAPALADPSVTINPAQLRTDSTQPELAIQGSGGAQLRCNVDNQDIASCGTTPQSCAGDVCATYRPAAPLASGSHTLIAYLQDSGGNVLAQAVSDVFVDTTPPGTQLGESATTTLRPEFGLTIFEDDPLASADSAECSLTEASAPPLWTPCGSGLHGGSSVTFRVPKPLPNRHVDYVFEGRAVDDFGRPDPTPVRVAFDPVPCALSARSLTISALIARGIPVTVNCTFTRHVTLDFFLLGKNGGHRVSIPFATDQYSNLGYASIHGLRTGFTVNTRLRLFRSFAPYFRSYRSAVLVVRVQKADGEGIPSYATVTVRQ